MAMTYIARILDPHHPGERDTFPGLMYDDAGAPIGTIRVRYTDDGGGARVSNYVHAGQSDDEQDHHTYSWESDTDWNSVEPDETDWIIELHPETD